MPWQRSGNMEWATKGEIIFIIFCNIIHGCLGLVVLLEPREDVHFGELYEQDKINAKLKFLKL